MNQKMSTIIVVGIVLGSVISGGVGIYLMTSYHNKSHEIFDNPFKDISFDNMFFDLSGAKSLLLLKDTIFSSNASVSSNAAGSGGGAWAVFGDDSTAATETTSLFKKDDLGNFVKVKLYENEQSMREGKDETLSGFEALEMEETDDGKFVFMLYGANNSRDKNNNNGYNVLRYIVVSLETGKIYLLNGDEGWSGYYNKSDYRYSIYSRYNMETTITQNDGSYKYLGSSGSSMYIQYSAVNGDTFYYIANEGEDGLNLKELINTTRLGVSKCQAYVHEGGILRLVSGSQTTLVFPGGELQNLTVPFKIWDDKICTSISYYDESGNQLFPSSVTAITGYDRSAHAFTTQVINYSQAESYRAAANNKVANELYREVGENTTTVVLMNKFNSVRTIHLNDNCTVTEDSPVDLPFQLEPLATDCQITDDRTMMETKYIVKFGHICQCPPIGNQVNPSDVMLNGCYLYKLDGDDITSYDLRDNSSRPINIPGLINIQSVEYIGEKVVIEGLSDNGKLVRGTYDYKNHTDELDLTYKDVLKEIIIKAMN